ncbi:MAG: malto-oligosyltrehalose trehalohydrolase [Microlunatus sp.]|nr:malto-oligosyltrehalose trehalohydrolase [Microlunatus sp.]MDN5769713.1 malto-oligosyltrehalose trehalohydrolase [Microlunatus sp.]MDN5804270.1 malto-oligosyltrehalose trehalohydrolase [Microlunatus sp.]
MTNEPFAVWAPKAEQVELMLVEPGSTEQRRLTMVADERGFWRPAEDVPEPPADRPLDYGYLLDGNDTPRADPRARRAPYGVHGLSRTFDPAAHVWSDQPWTGRQLPGGIVYELHVGTFTPEGTLRSAIGRLDHLVELGVTLVELMPVNAFNGPHGWGYDGVLWYAVHEEYGGPAAYQAFVDACHQRGLGVLQDVVYNHLGPSGNYLPEFGPYIADGPSNTWGETLNLDGEDSDEVRRYIIDNVVMWLRDYHVDGLRLDAVHALSDTRATHLLEEMAVEVSALSAFLNQPLSLIAESDLNNPRLITTREGGGYGLTGQWSDDFHHALYVSLTGDTTGYYADFDSLAALGKVFENGFFHDGTHSSFRGRGHGDKIDTLRTPAWRLVVCSDNHDQIGNRADGQRLSGKISPQQLGLAAFVTMLSPFTPMIFMGEEWGASTPWQFFTAHPERELAENIAVGRREEFAQMEWDLSQVPDPQNTQTFLGSKLDWGELERPVHAQLLALYKRLIRLRRTYPDLCDPRFARGSAISNDDEGWLLVERGDVALAVNFRENGVSVDLAGSGRELLTVGEADIADGTVRLAPFSAVAVLRS